MDRGGKFCSLYRKLAAALKPETSDQPDWEMACTLKCHYL
jgi:hypothetical protein